MFDFARSWQELWDIFRRSPEEGNDMRAMRRLGVALGLGIVLTAAATVAIGGASAAPATAKAVGKVAHKQHGKHKHGMYPYKIHVLGEWAHPDDDTSIIGPCGVWHERYGIRCGIIMITRGEGGGNAVGQELGPALGLRRENEDRVAHYRSGTVDIFNLDFVDFFYNQSAALSRFFWDHNEVLRRVTRIIRMTQPDVYIGFTPTFAAGHGHHQEAGRYIWEGVLAAADPNMFPEQLRGPNALDTWQVKKVISGGSTAGTGGTTTAPDCTTGFVPAATNLDTVVGVWTGYPSPYLWPPGNVQGQPAGTAKIWEQVHVEGTAAYPTQSRVMSKATAAPNCRRFGMTQAFVPFQPNTNPDGTGNPAAGRDNAILFGATIADPGGLPVGTTEYITFSRFYNVPGEAFQATVHVRSGGRALPRARVALTVPPGWSVGPARSLGTVTRARESKATFTIVPSAAAELNTNYKISALVTSGARTGYTDNVVRIVPPVEGRFQRWGKWAEYDAWLEEAAPTAARLGRSAAVQSIGIGKTISVPVEVHNWSTATQSGTVSLTLPANFTADATSKPYGPLPPGGEGTVTFSLTNTDSSLPANQNASIPITTTFSSPAGSGSETLALSLVPTTTIPQAAAAPTLDAAEGAGEYAGPALDLGRIWQGAGNCPPAVQGIDCGSAPGSTPGDPSSTYAKVTWHDDALYFFVHVRDEFQSYAVTPQECVGHWLADSVELLIDPRGNGSATNMDTATAFKLGVFPFTNDPTNFNGNGVNAPCWSRDADNHQGFSTGPLANTVDDPPNAPGVQVVSSATWVGSNETTVNHAYAGGFYNLEVKIPLGVLPSAVDPNRVGLNITPYDNDNTAAAGTTTLRHIDNSTRLAWSSFGSVQSDPYRWGLAALAGYTPPPGRSPTPTPPNVSHPNLDGIDSPETIAQSARDGVPISGRAPAPKGDRITDIDATLRATSVDLRIKATGPGTAHVFLWSGEKGYIPVWVTSCDPATNPPPDYGLSACAATDGTVPPWSPDMSGRVVRDVEVSVSRGKQRISIPLDSAAYAKLAANGSVLVGFETPNNEVQAFDVSLP
jgi:LmbE family N-acetylglucosaminyl deacetylase